MASTGFGLPVEFLGGPIDGHVETFGAPPEAFVCVKSYCPQRDGSVWRRLLGAFFAQRTTRIPVAVYELVARGGQLRYRYVSSQLVCEEDLHHQERLLGISQRACNLRG